MNAPAPAPAPTSMKQDYTELKKHSYTPGGNSPRNAIQGLPLCNNQPQTAGKTVTRVRETRSHKRQVLRSRMLYDHERIAEALYYDWVVLIAGAEQRC